jgi:hypothetical protein
LGGKIKQNTHDFLIHFNLVEHIPLRFKLEKAIYDKNLNTLSSVWATYGQHAGLISLKLRILSREAYMVKANSDPKPVAVALCGGRVEGS